MQAPSQQPPVHFKAQVDNLKDLKALCTFIPNLERHNFYHKCMKSYRHYHKNIQYAKSGQEPPAFSTTPNMALVVIKMFYTFDFIYQMKFV